MGVLKEEQQQVCQKTFLFPRRRQHAYTTLDSGLFGKVCRNLQTCQSQDVPQGPPWIVSSTRNGFFFNYMYNSSLQCCEYLTLSPPELAKLASASVHPG